MNPLAPPDSGFPRAYGKFELLRRLGDGGMAEVFLARLPGVAGFSKTLVLKRILPHLSRKKHFVDLFVAEATLAAEVRHRNVVQVFELGQVEGELYMAMEYVEGHDLRRLLRCASKEGLRIPTWFTVHVICEILDALTYGYELLDDQGRPRRVVHRDVTPSNIFISNQGDVKLGDFGVARDDTRQTQTRAGQLKGKVAYMAPEQIYSRTIDQRTDLFAVGIVLWECLAQRRLFGGRPDIDIMNTICKGKRVPPSNRLTDVPPELDRIVLKALQPEPDERHESAAAMQRELFAVLGQLKGRVTPADIRAVQLGLTKGLPAAGIVSGISQVKQETHTSDSALSFAALTSTDDVQNSGDLLANPVYGGDRGDSVADLDIDIDIDLVHPKSGGFTGLVDDLGSPAPVPASLPSQPQALPASAILSGTAVRPLEAQPRSSSGLYGFVKDRSTSDVPILAGQRVAPPRASSHVPPRIDSSASRRLSGRPLPRAPSHGGAAAELVHAAPSAPPVADASDEFDMDALVQEAVADVRTEMPNTPKISQDSLIAGLDSRRLQGDRGGRVSDRWAFVVDRQVYDGSYPFHLRDHEGAMIGPCSYEQALTIVQLEIQAGFGEQVGVGTEPGNYIRGRQMMELLGMSTLVRGERTIDSGVMDSEDRSPIRVFADYTRHPISGRLILFRDRTMHGDYREIEMVGGEPTFVWTETEALQYPQLLVSKRLLHKDAIVEFAHKAVRERRPLEAIAGAQLGTDLTRYRGMLMKERLVDLFSKGYSSYALRERTEMANTESFAPNLLQVALELTFRCLPREMITGHLGMHGAHKMAVADDFDRLMSRLTLSPEILRAVALLQKGRPLNRLVEQHPKQTRTLSTLSLFMVEAQLLSPMV